MNWLWVAFQKWGLRRAVCWPNCPLCAVNRREESHYEGCTACQGDGYPCEEMKTLHGEADKASRILFPDLDGPVNGSSVETIVFPPWDLSK